MRWQSVTLNLLAFFIANCRCNNGWRTINAIELRATKGQFFSHVLHSGNFFASTVDVKWTASLRGRPALPMWLHLMPSKHKPLGYLYGTPVTPLKQFTIHVIARSIDNYEKAEQFITIILTDSSRYNSTTQQFVEIRVKNVDAEDFLTDRTGLVDRLQASLRDAFRGRGLYPYIYQILAAGPPPNADIRYGTAQKTGCLIQAGTQSRFHINVINLMRGLKKNTEYCNRNPLVPLDKFFAPVFDVDWCNFYVRNMTEVTVHTDEEWLAQKPFTIIRHEAHNTLGASLQDDEQSAISTEKTPIIHTRYYFWESFLMFPMLGVCCILLLILLSFIFFGRREGQHWRDYKTSKQQLEEYASVRESQRHLRELSIQRQMLLMPSEKPNLPANSAGIHSFLQPKFSTADASSHEYHQEVPNRSSRSPLLKNQHKLSRTSPDKVLTEAAYMPLGKQTVAEAARACGSSLQLYRNPFEATVSDENDEQSLDGEDDNKS